VSIFDLVVVQPIFNLLVLIYSAIPGGDFGISIIIFTIIVRFALFPLVKRQLHQTKLMRKLQPELVKIKKQAKGNRQLESVQMLELYKKHGVSPFRSILILLIQVPIFIALYYVIQIFTLHRDQIAKFTYDVFENIGPIKQLIEHPDKFNEKLFGIVDLTQPAIGPHGYSIILIILAVAASYLQYVMSKQTMPQQESKKRFRDILAEAAEGKQADQSEMNAVMMSKMIKVLPIFMFFVMISVPGAIGLYYGVSNIVAVIQQSYLLRQDTEELEEIAEEVQPKVAKKATVKAREKAAKEATVTRITAKPAGRKK
jgi:YidC/Oxa1 family membrane protein insertase